MRVPHMKVLVASAAGVSILLFLLSSILRKPNLHLHHHENPELTPDFKVWTLSSKSSPDTEHRQPLLQLPIDIKEFIMGSRNIKLPVSSKSKSDGGALLPGTITEQMGPRNVTQVVKPLERTIILEPAPSEQVGRPFAIILVTSTVDAQEARDAVRKTWARWAPQLDIFLYFTIGVGGAQLEDPVLLQNLETELAYNNDLIVDNYQEGYYRLAGKILRMLKWFNATFSGKAGTTPLFLIKTDHDVFLNLPNIASALKKTPYYTKVILEQTGMVAVEPGSPDTYFVGGKTFDKAEVDSDPNSKWHISQVERNSLNWHGRFFPKYANGPCYVLSGNAAKAIYEASFSVPLFPFEDIYITGMVAHAELKLTISELPGMATGDWSWELIPALLSLHPVRTPFFMSQICKKISSCRELAKEAGPGNDEA